MEPDIVLNKDSVEMIGGPVEIKEDLRVEGSATVSGMLSADHLRIARSKIRTHESNDRFTVNISADQTNVRGSFRAYDTTLRSLSTPSIQSSSIVVGTPAGEEGATSGDDDDEGFDLRPGLGDIELDVDLLPEIPDPPRPVRDPDLPPDGPLPRLAATRMMSRAASDDEAEEQPPGDPSEMPGEDEPTVATITLRDIEGKNSIVLDAATGRIFMRGVGDLLVKIAELEARIAELEG